MKTQRTDNIISVVSEEILRVDVKIFKFLTWHIRPLQMITVV
jgi:hypothetical protein